MSAASKQHRGRPGSKFNPVPGFPGVWFNCDATGKAKVYGIRYRDELGVRRTVTVGPDFEAARIALAKATVASARGESTSNVNATLDDVIADWRGLRVLKKQSTAESYDKVIDLHVVPYLGGLRVKEITPPVIIKWISRLNAQGLAGSYQTRIYRALSIVLSHGVERGYVAGNACKALSANKRPRSDTPEKQILSREAEALTYARIAASRSRQWMEPYVRLALAQALRIGEVGALQWSDIDFENRTLTVARQVDINGRFLQADGSYILPKNGRIETVHMTQATYEVLHSRYLEWRISGSDNQWILFDPATGLPRHTVAIRKAWNDMRGDKEVTFHGLRHTCASRAVNGGVPIKVASTFMRHSSVSVTESYTHKDVSKADQERAMLDAALAA
jgi:integrase